jgi:hypothetical protein
MGDIKWFHEFKQWSADKVGQTRAKLFPPPTPKTAKPRQQQKRGSSHRNADRVLQIVLWGGFGAFLLASLPHVAYFFDAFEPNNFYWWIVAYALAASIDVTGFLLSYNVARKMRLATQGQPWGAAITNALLVVVTHWPFILVLVGFSWLVNYEHAVQFSNDMLSKLNTMNLVIPWFGSIPFSSLNPIIASAFPVLAIAYTGMSDRMNDEAESDEPVENQIVNLAPAPAIDLEAFAANLEAKLLANLTEVLNQRDQALLGSLQGSLEQRMEQLQRTYRTHVEMVRREVTNEVKVTMQSFSNQLPALAAGSVAGSPKQLNPPSEPATEPLSEIEQEKIDRRAKAFELLSKSDDPGKVPLSEIQEYAGVGKSYASALRAEFIEQQKALQPVGA